MNHSLREILKDSRGAYANHRERELEAALEQALDRLELAEKVCEAVEKEMMLMLAFEKDQTDTSAERAEDASMHLGDCVMAWRTSRGQS